MGLRTSMPTRRHFLQASTVAGLAASALAAQNQPENKISANDRIRVALIGAGGMGSADSESSQQVPGVELVAVSDIYQGRLTRAKERWGNQLFTTRDYREVLARKDIDAVLIATPDHWHAQISIDAMNAGKDVYCEKPCTKNIVQSLQLAETFHRTGCVFQAGTQRRSLPNFAFAVDLARRGKLGKLKTLYAQPWGLNTVSSGWPVPETPPNKEEVDWDLYLGPAAWRPYNKALLDGFNFEKGGGLVGGGCLEWGSHCVDLCQWANDADKTAPIDYEPAGKELHANYANGVKLVLRDENWLKLGSCPVRFEGETGWIETADDGDLVASSPELLVGKKEKVSGYPANFHIRDFLDCVKSRGQTRANVDAACHAHIACHASNIALFLNRKVEFDPVTNMFINDDQANRLRSEALREPWRI
jgi:Oxidoreductase family, NAD-binding Rossmann fold/Oxidoreductase family, C-terminal alpha/beta domain